MRCCCALGPRSQPAGSTCCTSSCGSTSCLIRVVAVALTAAGGGATRRGVWCERLVRSEPMLCGTGRRATRRHATQGTSLDTRRCDYTSSQPVPTEATARVHSFSLPPQYLVQHCGCRQAPRTKLPVPPPPRHVTVAPAEALPPPQPLAASWKCPISARTAAQCRAARGQTAVPVHLKGPWLREIQNVRLSSTPSTTNTSSHPV